MKVLQLCIRIPDPPADGGAIAMRAMATSLMQAGAAVQILAFNTRKHFVDPGKTDPAFSRATNLQAVYLDATVSIIPAFLNLFSSESYNITRFISAEFEKKLAALLQSGNFDVVQLESLFLAPYVKTIRQHSTARIVLRAHNVEYLIWQRMAGSCKSFIKRQYLRLLAEKLKNYEISMLNEYDAILPITREDEAVLRNDGCTKPLLVTPLGLDPAKYSRENRDMKKFSLFHLGSMDWMPNVEAIDWFLTNVFPALEKKSDITVYLAGKKMPAWIKHLGSRMLIVEDAISDAISYMSDKTVMVVPLLSGSGMRVKILEGMAMGKAVISTSIGAEGIDCRHEENILIADTPAEFVNWILACKNDPALVARIGDNAARLVSTRYDNSAIGRRVYEFYNRELVPYALQ